MKESSDWSNYKNRNIVKGARNGISAENGISTKKYDERQRLLVKGQKRQEISLCRPNNYVGRLCIYTGSHSRHNISLGVLYVEFIEVFEAPRAQAAWYRACTRG